MGQASVDEGQVAHNMPRIQSTFLSLHAIGGTRLVMSFEDRGKDGKRNCLMVPLIAPGTFREGRLNLRAKSYFNWGNKG